jgi:hypothetical protein
MFLKKTICCFIPLMSLCAYIRQPGPIIMSYGFEKNEFKSGKDTTFRSDLWKPYLHTGEVNTNKCALGNYIPGFVSSTLSRLQARSGSQSGQCIMDVSNGGICHKAMFRNDFLPKGADISAANNERWISFSLFLPDRGQDAWVNDQVDELVFQLHNDTIASPQLALYSDKGIFSVRYRYADKDPHQDAHTRQFVMKPWEGSVKTGRWIDWIWHIKFSPLAAKGILQVWANQGDGLKQIVDEQHIRMGYPCDQITTFDIGLYKWQWKCPSISPVKRRVIYIDDIKVGNALAGLSDMINH